MPNPIWSRSFWYSGSDGTNFTDDDNDGNNNVSPAAKGFSIVISTVVDTVVSRSKIIRSLFYQIGKWALHKEEDIATATSVGADTDSTALGYYVASDQLPSVITQNDTINGNDIPFIEITPVTISTKNKKYSVHLSAQGIALFNTTNSKVLVVNSANPNNGDGSFANPFKTIDILLTYIDTNNLYPSAFPSTNGIYTILVFGGTYTTSNNLSIGHTWYFYPGAIISYTGSGWLFDMNSNAGISGTTTPVSGRFNIRIYGYLQFTSSIGFFIKTYKSSFSGTNSTVALIEFESAISTQGSTSLALCEFYEYASGGVNHNLQGNLINSTLVLKFGDTSGSINSSAIIRCNQIFGTVDFSRINFVDIYNANIFMATGVTWKLTSAIDSNSVINISNSTFNLINNGIRIFTAKPAFSAVSAPLKLNNVDVTYGNTSIATHITFDISAITTAVGTSLIVDAYLYKSSPTSDYSTGNAGVVNVANGINILYAAGSIRYSY